MKEFEIDPFQNQASERLRGLGIKALLFDLDDTLIYMSEIFKGYMAEYVEVVSATLEIDPSIFSKRLQELNDEGYQKMGVSPRRWESVLEQLFYEFNENKAITDNLDILMRIYTTEPRIRPGAKAILSGLKENDLKLCCVTHANSDWTYRKLTQTGLLDYFDAIEIADENGSKTIENWKKGMELLGVSPDQCLNVGDNLKGDIVPSVILGARAIWMPSPWSVYREGEVPLGVVQMEDLSGFWDAVQKLS